jgi:hypothetical protein
MRRSWDEASFQETDWFAGILPSQKKKKKSKNNISGLKMFKGQLTQNSAKPTQGVWGLAPKKMMDTVVFLASNQEAEAHRRRYRDRAPENKFGPRLLWWIELILSCEGVHKYASAAAKITEWFG